MPVAKRDLTEKENYAAERLLQAADIAWNTLNQRRGYDWKLSFGVWTALAVLTGFAMRGQSRVTAPFPLAFCVLLGLIWILHVWFAVYVKLANNIDQKQALCYQSHANKLLAINFKTDDITRKAMEWVDNPWRFRGWWWFVLQALITTTLTASAWLAMALASPKGTDEFRQVTAREFKVERVIDGNSFEVVYDGDLTSVRFHRIDALEPGTPEGQAATAALASLIEGKVVRLAFPGERKRDALGRLVCRVHTDVDVGDEMLRQGHAKSREPKR